MSTRDQQFVNAAVRKYLLAFAVAIDPAYNINWHHEEIAMRLEKALDDLVLRNLSTNIILTVPPRHGKSDLASVKFPSWALGKYPELPIIVTSYSADLAEGFGQKARDIMELEEYQAHFDTRLRPDSKAKAKWNTQKPGEPDESGESEMVNTKGGYTAAGVGGPITGKGFKIGIIDDIFKNRKDADSETMRDNAWSWYKSTFRTRQEGAAIKIVIITRWHQDDIVGRLLEEQEKARNAGEADYDRWEVIDFPAIAEKAEPQRKKGEALWPWKFTLAQLNATRNALGPYEFSALYQQKPIPSEKQEFKKKWFKYFHDQDLLKKTLEYMTTVDLATGENQESDDVVVITVGKELTKPDWYIVEITGGQLDPGETIDEIFRHVRKYRSTVGLEEVQYQKALRYFITERMREKEFYFNVYPLKRNQNTAKVIRIRGLIPLYAAGVIHHRAGVHQKLEDQLTAFPQGKHDDYPDALASQLEMWSGTLFERDGSQSKDSGGHEQTRVSDLQGTIEPKVNEGADVSDGVFDGVDISRL